MNLPTLSNKRLGGSQLELWVKRQKRGCNTSLGKGKVNISKEREG